MVSCGSRCALMGGHSGAVRIGGKFKPGPTDSDVSCGGVQLPAKSRPGSASSGNQLYRLTSSLFALFPP